MMSGRKQAYMASVATSLETIGYDIINEDQKEGWAKHAALGNSSGYTISIR